MKFKTTLEIEKQEIQIDHKSGVILLGSCFTEHIGMKLNRYKFDTLVNPFGTIFHPAPIAWLIEQAIEKNRILADDIEYNGALYFHDQFHYKFSSTNKQTIENNINLALASFHDTLCQAKFLFISFGSAIGYTYIKKNRIVANCHKLAQKEFDKSFSSIDYLMEIWDTILKKLRLFNPEIRVIFTISPVRHIKDGIVASSHSKALLNVFVHSLIKTNNQLYYFPSFEIMMDDLRDYRFYDDDLIHPANMAVEYIWEGFSAAYFSSRTLEINRKIEKIQKSRAHKIQHNASDANKAFANKQLKRIEEIRSQHPEIDLNEELNYFRNLI